METKIESSEGIVSAGDSNEVIFVQKEGLDTESVSVVSIDVPNASGEWQNDDEVVAAATSDIAAKAAAAVAAEEVASATATMPAAAEAATAAAASSISETRTSGGADDDGNSSVDAANVNEGFCQRTTEDDCRSKSKGGPAANENYGDTRSESSNSSDREQLTVGHVTVSTIPYSGTDGNSNYSQDSLFELLQLYEMAFTTNFANRCCMRESKRETDQQVHWMEQVSQVKAFRMPFNFGLHNKKQCFNLSI